MLVSEQTLRLTFQPQFDLSKLVDVIAKAELLSYKTIPEENVNEEIAQIEAHTRSYFHPDPKKARLFHK